MRKMIGFLFLILLQGCSFYNPFSHEEIDKVTVVKYTPYLRHHRAFLSRSNLNILKNKEKYLYLYKKKTNDLAVLVQRRNTFFLYTLSNPEQKVYTLMTFRKEKYTYALNHFKSMGYSTLSSPSKKGFIVTVSHKRYKNIKTLLFEIKDYTRLLKLYKKAISGYDANKIKTIKTQLPKSLILAYYKYYEKRTKDLKKLGHLKIIANKLQIKEPEIAKEVIQASEATQKETKKIAKSQENHKETSSWYDFTTNKTETEKEPIIQKSSVSLPYTYYLNHASLSELHTYLLKSTTKKSLSTSKYLKLKRKKKNMEEREMLRTGTLEELITAYKSNKNPKFKQRILSLMKEKQQ